ncbi:hypothetical protein S7335_1232 [Synechococcus sp. PCC 7335]|nr:hypothetical protein S7335_1232 [Synechococcus sp. PCC 7335]
MHLTLTGRITITAVDSFVKYLGYDKKIVTEHAIASSYATGTEPYTNWLVDTNRSLTHCRYYPGELLLSIANAK